MPTFLQQPSYPFAQQRGQGVTVPGGLPGARMGCHMGAPLSETLEGAGVPLASDLVAAERSDARKEGFNQGLLIGAGGAVAVGLVLKAVPLVLKVGAVAAAGWYFFGRKS